MATKVFVLALVFLLAEMATLQQQPRVEMGEAIEGGDSKTYNIRVECPDICTEKIPFELDCLSGTLSAAERLTREHLHTVEEKLRALEKILVPSSWDSAKEGRRDITSRIFSLEEKIGRVLQALSEQ